MVVGQDKIYGKVGFLVLIERWRIGFSLLVFLFSEMFVPVFSMMLVFERYSSASDVG